MRTVKNFGVSRVMNIIDAICGAGKTSWAIQYMNETLNDFGNEKKFIFVTPFLDEVERIKKATNIEFFEPKASKGKGSKMEHFRAMVILGQSIVTTHALFKNLDLDTLDMIEEAGYTLIMDEVANVLEQYDIEKSDIDLLLHKNTIEIEEDGTVIWLDDTYKGEFSNLKILAESENLILRNGYFMFWTMNTRAFEAFEEVFVLTYLFDAQAQCNYYKMKDIKFKKHSVKNIDGCFELIEYNPQVEPRKKLYNLLNIYEDYQNGKSVSKLNTNFDSREHLTDRQKRGELSSTWFKHASEKDLKQLSNNLNNYFRNQAPADNDNLYWTTVKEFAPKLKNPKCKLNKKDERDKDNFLAFNARATNDYGHCTSVAFVYNRFINPLERNFFASYNVNIDEDLLAVSDLIQFLFRGCIRNGEPMNCYIPAERMRILLKDWSEYKI